MSLSAAGLTYDEAGIGVPVVLIHAFPQSRDMWKPQLSVLSKTARVIAPDVFGFGNTPVPDGGWTVDSYADALANFLAVLTVQEPVVLGGLSMGGYIAMAFARRHPRWLKALILADTKADADTDEAKAGRDKSIEFVRGSSAKALTKTMIPKVLGETTRKLRPEVVDRVTAIGGGQSVEGVAAGLVALRDRPDATPELSKIEVPTLILVGGEDTVTPPDAAKKIAAAIPKSTLVELPAAGHLSNLETPDAFNTAVREFLATL